MEVLVKLHDELREKAGTDTIKMPIANHETIDTLLIKIGRRHSTLLDHILDPITGELRSDLTILLNGRPIPAGLGIHTKLKHKDEITISPSKAEEQRAVQP